MDIIKQLCGYSGSQVLLMQDGQRTFVRKFGQNQRNLERIDPLASMGITLPRIYSRHDDYYDMEYIKHVDMVTWLTHNPVDGFVRWLLDIINEFNKHSVPRDYLQIYEERLSIPAIQGFMDVLPFRKDELIEKLPRMLPCGPYHGDLTMDNCLHGADGRFYLIDPLTSDYDGWVFDVAKLMQDLYCGWFIRDKNVMIRGKLWAMRSAIIAAHPIAEDRNLLILMLLRILPYARSDADRDFILREIDKLWTS